MENHQNHKPNLNPDLEKKPPPQVWGTWEELLLACAVNRHGFKDWDAVAMEVQSRTSLPNLHVTATLCEQKFHDLRRRFAPQCNDVVSNGDSDHVPWLDELRNLRVAELRRDLQRYDVSILSLQSKVKRLEEEREKENDGKDDEKPDLAVSGEEPQGTEKTGREGEETEPVGSEPETDKLMQTVGDESDRENQSVNESNSTGSRFEGGKTGEGNVGVGPDTVRAGPKEPDPGGRKGRAVGEESNNGSCDTEANKVRTCESLPPSEERKVDSSELRGCDDSVEGGTRESGEVESSASLTRKRKTRRRKEVSGGGGGGEVAPDNDDVAMRKSEPLAGVLEMIKGHEHSSLFERRLESQDSNRYKNMVRQHVDLETIQLRLQKGYYSSCTSSFFRDLLLLFTNATVFFPKDSAESRAAQQLRHLVAVEMNNHSQAQSDPTPQKTDSLPPNAPLAKADSLFSKHKASAPILVCRKRSSMASKPSSATFGQKGDQSIINDKKEKPLSDAKPTLKPSSSDTDEEEPPKAKEKPVTGARSLRRSNKNLNNNANKKLPSNSTLKAGSSAGKPGETLKPEKSKAEGVQDKKRNAAADFLKRIKRNAPAEGLRSSGGGGGGGSSSSSKGGGGGGVSVKEQKKMVNSGKGDKGKERASRLNGAGGSGSGDKRNKNVENSSQSKRSVGRPPKKAAESNAVSGKRGREGSASAGKDKRPKKRSKK